VVNQEECHRFNAVRPDQVRGLGLELRQLQNRDFGPVIHYLEYTAVRYKLCAADCQLLNHAAQVAPGLKKLL
jgi:hypothetical protein